MADRTRKLLLFATLFLGFLYLLTFNILLFSSSAMWDFLRGILLKEASTKLIILSYGRSGSSFLGQLFNQHPNVFYVYEPLKMIKTTTLGDSEFYEANAVNLIKDILDCRMDGHEEFLNFLSHMHHYRFSSKALTQPFCVRNESASSTGKAIYFCRPLEISETNQVCSKHKHRVVKILITRIPQLSVYFFKPFLHLEGELRILHLVRDPRSVVASMERVGWISESVDPSQSGSPNFESRVQMFCNTMLETLAFIFNAENTLRGKYKLLKYEDLVRDVYGVANEVLQFADIRGENIVERWIRRSTNAATSETKADNYQYLTNRANISGLVDAWKTRLSKYQIRTVERHCHPLMTVLGYRTMFPVEPG